MKKIIFTLTLLIALSASIYASDYLNSQNRKSFMSRANSTVSNVLSNGSALGLRFGGGVFALGGAEVSYQTPFKDNRLEFDLGAYLKTDYFVFTVAGIYQIVNPIEAGFSWYYGGGARLGASVSGNSVGFYAGILGQIGLEYRFPKIPLQLSIDTRPELSLSKDSTLSDVSSVNFGVYLAARYCF